MRVLLACLCLVVACNRVSSHPPRAREGAAALGEAQLRALALASRAERLQRVDGRLAMGDGEAAFSGYFEGRELRIIEEHLDLGDHGRSDNRYWVERGRLFFYESRGVRAELAPGMPAARRTVEVRMAFDATGALVAASKAADGLVAPLAPDEAAGVRARFERLVSALGRERGP